MSRTVLSLPPSLPWPPSRSLALGAPPPALLHPGAPLEWCRALGGWGSHPSSLPGAACSASPHCSTGVQWGPPSSAPQHCGPPTQPHGMSVPWGPPVQPHGSGDPQLSSLVLDVMGTTSSASASSSPLPRPPQPGCDQAPCESRNTLFLGQLWPPRDKGDTGGQVVTRDTASTGCAAPSMLQRGGVQVSP